MKFQGASLASAVALIFVAAGCSGSGGGAGLPAPEKPNIVVDAFPAIDSAGLYVAQMDHLFAAQGLNVTIETAQTTQTEIDGQVQGRYDITTGDYVTYINNELTGRAKLRIVVKASFLQPNVLTLLVRSGSSITSAGELRDKSISINAPDDIGTLLVDSLLVEHGIPPKDVKFDSNVAFPAVAASLVGDKISAPFAPEPFVSLDEQKHGIQELADLDQGSTVDFPIQGYAVTQAWADKYPHTLAAFLRALSQGQEIADTDRTAVELALGKYLQISRQTAAFLSLPSFPTGVDPARLQRVVSAMLRFGLLPRSDGSFSITSMVGA
ncbi:MAG: ABC transporter substrate-binding protein [Streptosporangiaceae bacterium]